MKKFNTSIFAAVAAVALSLSFVGTASAVIPDAPAPKGAPAASGQQGAIPSDQYQAAHKGAVAFITKFTTALHASAEVKASLAGLSTELAKLPSLEKAYVDAKHANKDADAKKAQDDYAASVQKIIDLALPMDQGLMQTRARIMAGFEQMGPVGEKLKAESDIAALLADIDATLKPLDTANELVGPIHDAAMASAQKRIEAEGQKIFGEELNSAIGSALQSKLK